MKKKITNMFLMLSVAILACLSLTGCAGTGTEGGGAGGASGLIIMVVMLVLLYMLMIRPENKKRKKAEEMRNNLSVGDKITTIGGIVGKIVDISGDLITFETGEDRVRLQVTKWAVSTNNIDKSGENK